MHEDAAAGARRDRRGVVAHDDGERVQAVVAVHLLGRRVLARVLAIDHAVVGRGLHVIDADELVGGDTIWQPHTRGRRVGPEGLLEREHPGGRATIAFALLRIAGVAAGRLVEPGPPAEACVAEHDGDRLPHPRPSPSGAALPALQTRAARAPVGVRDHQQLACVLRQAERTGLRGQAPQEQRREERASGEPHLFQRTTACGP